MAPKAKPSIFAPTPKRRPPAAPSGSDIFTLSAVQAETTANDSVGGFGDFKSKDRFGRPIFTEIPLPVSETPDYEAPPMLYEGNYVEWRDKISNMLLALSFQGMSLDGSSDTFSEKAVRHIKRFVRRELLERVPQDRQDDINKIMGALGRIARPFRLMDLPPEVRISIYTILLEQKAPIILLATPNIDKPHPGKNKVAKVPPLTMTSHAVREETMPIYFQLNTFRMAFNHLPPKDVPPSQPLYDRFMLDWAEAHKIWAKHLRKLLITLRPVQRSPTGRKSRPGWELTYEPNSGLTVKLLDCNHTESHKKFLARTNNVESYRRYLRLEGEVLATVLYRNWLMLMSRMAYGEKCSGPLAKTEGNTERYHEGVTLGNRLKRKIQWISDDHDTRAQMS